MTRSLLTPLRLAFGLLTLFAIGTQFTIHLGMGYSPVNFFSYFTNLANLFAAIVLLFVACRSLTTSREGRFEDTLRVASVVNMTIVGIVFSVLLRNVDLGALRPWIKVVVHYVMPLAVVLEWLLAPSSARLGTRHWLLCLIFPVCYLAYVLIRGARVDWYPYPFLDPAHVDGYAGVAVYAAGIAAAFLIAGWR